MGEESTRPLVAVADEDGYVCPRWSDHEWHSRQFVEAGRHPTMGHYVRHLVKCRICTKTTTETEWTGLPPDTHDRLGGGRR